MLDEDEINYLKQEDAHNRRNQARLARNPDCRDPDHPDELCPYCNPEEENDE